MEGMHLKLDPEGITIDTDVFYGTHINAPDFTKIGACGERAEHPEQVRRALRNGVKAMDKGRSVIIDNAIK